MLHRQTRDQYAVVSHYQQICCNRGTHFHQIIGIPWEQTVRLSFSTSSYFHVSQR